MTTVSVRMAAASGEDIKLAWAVYRAAQRLQYENWNYSARDIDFENLSRLEKLFFLRCYKFAVEEGAFNRIFGGYETLFANVCDPTSNVLEFKPSLARQLQDGELLPVVLEAYAEAAHEGAVNWEAAASLNVENEELKHRIAALESSHAKLREAMAGIHNTIRLDGVSTPLAAILRVAKQAYEEAGSTAGVKREDGHD